MVRYTHQLKPTAFSSSNLHPTLGDLHNNEKAGVWITLNLAAQSEMKRKKTFPCGHSGYGGFCHACQTAEKEATAKSASLAARIAEKEARRSAFNADTVDLRDLPSALLLEKARTILHAIAGGSNYRLFKGKRLNYDRTVISVPIGYNYRLLFIEQSDGHLVPKQLLSHEDYNATKPG
jgi:hypothetical protein